MLVVPTDVTNPASIASLFDTVKTTYGRIDLLFNNAGISTRNIPIEDLTLEQWSNVVATNLTGSFLCAQHAFRMMKSQTPRDGRIIELVAGARDRRFHQKARMSASGFTDSRGVRVMSGVASTMCAPACQITTRCARLNGGGGAPSFASA